MEGIPKLYYFGAINGRAAVSRAIFHYKKVDFEDVRISFEDWFKLKKSGDFEFEQLPKLEIDGKSYFQSAAIEIYLAQKYGLYPSDIEEQYLVNSLILSINDISPKYTNWSMPMNATDKQNVEANKKAWKEVHAPFFLNIFEKRFEKSSGKHFIGDNFTLADIWIGVVCYMVFLNPKRREEFEPIIKQSAPKLYEYVSNLIQNELADYIAKGYIQESF